MHRLAPLCLLALAACAAPGLMTPHPIASPLERFEGRPIVIRAFAGGHEAVAQCAIKGPGYGIDLVTPAALSLPVGAGGAFDATDIRCTAGTAAGRWSGIPGADTGEVRLELAGPAEPAGKIVVLGPGG